MYILTFNHIKKFIKDNIVLNGSRSLNFVQNYVSFSQFYRDHYLDYTII